jgi:DNA-directed RNA polymerase subunit RPC12/RpoP
VSRLVTSSVRTLETDSYPCSSNFLPNSPRTCCYPSPGQAHADRGSFYSPTPFTPFPTHPAARVLTEPPCGGGIPIKQKGGGYICSVCRKLFKRRDCTKRHIDTAGMQVSCKYCGKPASGRRDGMSRHLRDNQACLKIWEADHRAGRFTDRSRMDAYYY